MVTCGTNHIIIVFARDHCMFSQFRFEFPTTQQKTCHLQGCPIPGCCVVEGWR